MSYRKILQIILVVLVIALTGVASAQDGDKPYLIGDLILVGDIGLKTGMTEMGYVEGQDVNYLYIQFDANIMFGTPEWMEFYQQQVEAMVDAGVDVFVVNNDSDIPVIKSIIGDIPVVFARSDDPIASGVVQDLVTPGGTATGIVTNRPHERRLQLLTEIKPSTEKIFYPYNAYNLDSEKVLQQVLGIAEELGIEVVAAPITDRASQEEALRKLTEDIDWVFLTPNTYFELDLTQEMMNTAIANQTAFANFVDLPTIGYTINYGPSLDGTGAQAAQIVDRILRGGNPGDLPVQTAENYLSVDLPAAETIGLEIPVSILRQANLIVRPGYEYRDAFGNPIVPAN